MAKVDYCMVCGQTWVEYGSHPHILEDSEGGEIIAMFTEKHPNGRKPTYAEELFYF